MKILLLLPNNILGGAEQYLKMVAEHYKTQELDIVFLRKDSTSLWDDIEDVSNQQFMSERNESHGLMRFFFKILFNRKSYDYIFTSHVSTNAFIGLMLNLRLLKTNTFIARESTTIFTRFKGKSLVKYKLLYRLGYRKINLLICQTDLMKNQLIEYFPEIVQRTKVEVVPNPINKTQIKIMAQAEADVSLPEEYIVSAGRLIELKGFDLLIASLAKLKKQFPKLKLVILGKGILKEELKKQAELLGVREDVIFAGHVANVYPYFRKAKICVVSSRVEGFPNVLLQMMSQNNNIVSTKCAGGIDKIPQINTAEANSLESLYNEIFKALTNYNDNTNNIHSEYLDLRDIKGFMKHINNLCKG